MSQRFLRTTAFVLLVTASISCFACLWDKDTLSMERQRFPSVLELITGTFLRHSNEFYRWRVEDRKTKIEVEATPDLFDDLAVAYEKLGETDNAIRVINQKSVLFPGLYSTHANLGTFYIHAGRLKEGLTEIDTALAINPEAHFGREVYQKRLVEYLLSRDADGHTNLPLSATNLAGMSTGGFAKFLLITDGQDLTEGERNELLDKAIEGVLGMMKFGNYDSPVLLEVLGDLLLSRQFPADAKRLAARAYLKAAYNTQELDGKQAYRGKAKACLQFQSRGEGTTQELSIDVLEAQFAEELKGAAVWRESIVDQEMKWISAGVNVDKAFDEKYYEEPEATVVEASAAAERTMLWVVVVIVSLMLTLCIGMSCWKLRAHKKQPSGYHQSV
jgi:tetratricopeptide (TPR) repeat protein